MFTVKLETRHGWTIKYADEVRIGEVTVCSGPGTVHSYPTVNIDTCRSGGGNECVLLSHDLRLIESTDLADTEVAQSVLVETPQGHVTHEHYAPPPINAAAAA